jgi:hypothetical protein
MKFICLIAAVFAAAISTAQVQVSVFAGPQITTARYKVDDAKQKTEYQIGFQAGAGLKTQFEGRLYFSPSVFYSLKGYKVKFDKYTFPPDPEATDNKVTVHTFEIAPLLQLNFSDAPDHLFIQFGPSVDLQLFGKEKFNLFSGESVNQNLKFGYASYGRYSTSAIFRLGYEKENGFIFFAQYSLGLTSINNADNGPVIRHRTAGISIGKYLNSRKMVLDTRNRP